MQYDSQRLTGVPLPRVTAARQRELSAEALRDASALALAVAPSVPDDDETGPQPRWGGAEAAVLYGVDLAELAERVGASGAVGDVKVVHLPKAVGSAKLPWSALPHRILFVGTGSATESDLRKAGAALARAARGFGRVVTTVGAEADDDAVRAFIEGYHLGAYTPPKFVSGDAGDSDEASGNSAGSNGAGATSTAEAGANAASDLVIFGQPRADVLAAASAGPRASWRARDLATVPSNIKNPQWFAQRVTELITASAPELSTEILGQSQIADQQFGGILAVSAGSQHEPRFVVVRYQPATIAARHVVLVGKGITYDTGGLSIKPRTAMVPMKTDMSGAAAALAAVIGAAELGLPHRVTAVLPLAENAVGASSYRPGDVVRVYGGKTVEIANTDAEGRMVLADALAWADAQLDPDLLIDIATLTGAASVGLGKRHAALFTEDDDLAESLSGAGAVSGERVWRMPLVADYAAAVKSDIADLRHVPATNEFGGGAITAALFLQQFVGSRRWAHLDIAGPARAGAAEHEVSAGATGFGARLLLRWLENLP